MTVAEKKGVVRWSKVMGKSTTYFGEDVRGRLFAVAFDGNVYRVVLKGPRA